LVLTVTWWKLFEMLIRGLDLSSEELLHLKEMAGLSHLCGVARIHNTNRIPKRPVNPGSSQVLGMCKPQAAATRPNIKARTRGTRGLFTPVLALPFSLREECSSADGFSDMNLLPLSFKEIIPNSN
jgi:hypothetical protein